jgi:hypothetical protein
MKMKKYNFVKKWGVVGLGLIACMAIYLGPLQSRHSDARDHSSSSIIASSIEKDVKNGSQKNTFNRLEANSGSLVENFDDEYAEAADFLDDTNKSTACGPSKKVSNEVTPPYGLKLRTAKGRYIQTEEACRAYCTKQCGQGITEEWANQHCIPECYLQHCPQFKYTSW